MPLPADLQTGFVTGQLLEPSGAPLKGRVSFEMRPERITSQGGEVIVLRKPLVATLGPTGEFTIELPGTDDPDYVPVDFTYRVEVMPIGGGGYVFDMEVPAGVTTDISTVIWIDPNTGIPYLKGDPGEGIGEVIDGGLKYYIPALADWYTKLNAATVASPVEIVIIGDSITRYGSPSWPTRWADDINRRLGSTKNAPESITGGEMSGGGASVSVGLGHMSRRLTAGQTATFTTSCDKLGIAYSGGGGTLTVKDGATTIGTIDTSLVSGRSHVWWSGALTYNAKTISIECTLATTDVEAALPLAESRALIWNAGRSGSPSLDFISDPDMAFTLIDRIQPDMIIVATGTNDDPGAGAKVEDLFAALDPHVPPGCTVVQWVPYASAAIAFSEIAGIRAVGRARGLPQIDAGAVANRLGLIDTIHPEGSGAQMLGGLASLSLNGDPISVIAWAMNAGAALKAAGVGAIDAKTSSVVGLGGGGGFAITDHNGITAMTSTSRGVSFGGAFAAGSRAIDVGSIRLKNLGAAPPGPNLQGDIALIAGVHSKCTVSGSPGTWAPL